jgi:hypothetical protein
LNFLICLRFCLCCSANLPVLPTCEANHWRRFGSPPQKCSYDTYRYFTRWHQHNITSPWQIRSIMAGVCSGLKFCRFSADIK